MKHHVLPVILCGGSGTRLWPLSRSGFPKQFLVFKGETSLFQQAVERLNQLDSNDIVVGPTLVVTNEDHRFMALEQLREINSIQSSLLLEPLARNTAPALTKPFKILKHSNWLCKKASELQRVVKLLFWVSRRIDLKQVTATSSILALWVCMVSTR